jgi:hypothetical protein
MWRFSKFDFGRVLMRASVAGLLAVCALIGIPRLVSELREYRSESQKPAPLAISAPPENRPAAIIAPPPKVPDAAALPKQAPVQLVTQQRDSSPLPGVGAGAKPANPASQASEAELVAAIQKELTRLGLYDGPVTDKWSRPVRIAAAGFLRKAGSRTRHPQPTAGLLAMLKAAEPVKKQAASPPEAARSEEKTAVISRSSVKVPPPKQSIAALESADRWTEGVKETPLEQSAAAPVPAVQNDDYLPPWMTAKTDQAGFASRSEAARSDAPVVAPTGFDEATTRRFHRRRHTRRHYDGYYGRRRASLFPF